MLFVDTYNPIKNTISSSTHMYCPQFTLFVVTELSTELTSIQYNVECMGIHCMRQKGELCALNNSSIIWVLKKKYLAFKIFEYPYPKSTLSPYLRLPIPAAALSTKEAAATKRERAVRAATICVRGVHA